ncbi:MAG: N-acyl-D-amino-acid deacylase family protein [Vicinamibacterales bacterium]
MPGRRYALLLVFALAPALLAQGTEYDLVIRGGRVLDGTGNPFVLADVAVKDGRIAAIGRLPGGRAARTIDARGHYVTPGFIDMHSHGGPGNHDAALRNEHNSVMQGITTAVHNPDGGSMWPVADHLDRYGRDGIGVNVVMMVGHNKIRQLAMGNAPRVASAAELDRMTDLLRQGLREGAFGLTLGLEGVPGRWSDTHELVALATVIAGHNGFLHAHQRAEGRSPRWWNASTPGQPVDGIEATRETIEIGERSGARVMATHFKVLGKDFWGSSDAMLRMLDEARARGVQVFLDTYTYESYGNTATVALVPHWALVDDGVDIGGQDGGLAGTLTQPYARAQQNLRRRLADAGLAYKVRRDIEYEIAKAGGPDRVLLVEHPKAEYRGRFLADVAAMHGEDPIDAAIRLQMEGEPSRPGGGAYRGFNIAEIDNERIVQKNYVAYSTDGGAVRFGEGFPHRRYYGIYPHILRQYVFEKGLVSLPFAVRAMTSLPATIIGLEDRGLLRTGNWADITVFDPVTIRPTSTYMKPHSYPVGIRYVLVNGQLAVDEGTLANRLAGRALRPAWAEQKSTSSPQL